MTPSESSSKPSVANLLPCPFCGVGAVTFDTHDKDADRPFYAVACPQCHCMTTEYAQLKHAIEVWNTRQSVAEIDELRAALKEALAILEKADLCNVSEKHKWANTISEARVHLYKALDSHPVTPGPRNQ